MNNVIIEGKLFSGGVGQLTKGSVVELSYVTSVPGTDRALVISNNGDHIGYGTAKVDGSNTSLMGSDDLYDKIPEDKRSEFTARVAELAASGNYTIAKLAVDMHQFGVATGSSSNKGAKEIELKVSGSIRDCKAKSAVIKAFKSGKSVTVTISEGDESDNGVLLTYAPMKLDRQGNVAKAGLVRPVNTELEDLKELLTSLKTIEATVIGAEDTSYTLLVKVDADVAAAVESGTPIPDINNIKEQLINDGISTANIIDNVVDYLQKCDVSVKTIMKVLKTYKKYDTEAAALIPTTPETPFVDDNNFVKRSVVYLLGSATNALRFTGDAGTGKNTLITQLAWIFQRPLMEKAVNADLDKYDLLGSKTTDSTVDENGNVNTKIVFEAENLIKAMKVGGFFNLDEINMGDAGVLSLIHPILDGRGYIDVPGYGRVVANEDFRAFSTMNIGYSGTQELNTATADRFTTLNFEAKESILSILKNHADTRDASDQHIKIADELYRGIYRMVVDQELEDKCLTIRGFIRAVSYAEDLGIRTTLIDNVANRVDVPEYKQHIVDFIDTIC